MFNFSTILPYSITSSILTLCVYYYWLQPIVEEISSLFAPKAHSQKTLDIVSNMIRRVGLG